MKLSKKLVSMILVAAMLIAQVSVLPFATESYSSGKGDSASYALAVPDTDSVGFGTAVDGLGSWVDSSVSLGRNDDDTGYASDRRGKIFITEDNGERFFVLNPSAKYAEVIFKNAPANTYTAESPEIFNGVPSAINYKKLNAMAFRIKAMGTVADKLVIDIQLTNKNGTTVAYTAKDNMLFMDAATGAVSKVSYTESGIEIAGNANGWLYVPFTGFIGKDSAKLSDCVGEFFEVSNAYNPSATGYKGIKVTFKNDAFNSESKKMLFGDALFVENETSFRRVHGSPAAPTVKELGKDFIKLNAEDGVVYSLSQDGTYSASGEFKGLTAGKKYTIYSKFADGTGVSSCIVYTKGVADIEVVYTDYDTIKVYAVSGMEYCLDGNWKKKNTTGVFEGLEYNKSYKVYVREVGGSETKTKTVKTTALPYTTGMEETAYYALNIPSSVTELKGAYGSFTGSITALPVVNKNGVNYVQIAPNSTTESTANIGANALTYNKPTYGLPADIVRYEYINGIAFRMSVEGGSDGVESKFNITLHDNHKLQNGVYEFINVSDGSVSEITYDNGFVVKGALDGWLVISFENIRFSEDVALTGKYNQSMYRDVLITLTEDWTGRTLNVGTGLFFEDYTTFMRAYSLPHNHEYYRNKTVIDITPADGVEYLLVGTKKWTTNSRFENLTPDTVYTFRARYIGRTDYSEFTVKTRLADPTLTAPVPGDLTVTATTIVVNAPREDHEYSVDGINWTESGVFEGLLSGTAYNLVARIFETTKETKPLVVVTKSTVYATNLNDSASYLFRVPTLDDVAGSDTNGIYITSAENNNSSIEWGVKNDPTKYYIKDKNGYNFIELLGKETSVVYEFKSAIKYNGAPFITGGLPEDIKANGVKAIALRFAIDGNKEDEYALFDVIVKILSKANYTRKVGQIMFIDAKTGKVTDLEHRAGIKFYGNVDGWVVIPCESFTNEFAQEILNKYEGLFRINLKKEFANNKFYLGEVLAVADIDKFLQVRSAPRVPTLLEKDAKSISVVSVPGIEYSLDKTNWNTTGVFTGLKAGKKYEIYAKYTAGNVNGTGALISEPLVVYADQKNPSTDAIEVESLTATKIVFKAVPGLKYTIDGGNTWTEFGVFDNLDPNTKYNLYGASKTSQGTTTPTHTFTTPKADNPYDLGDGSSIYMPVSSYGEYYQNKYGYSKQLAHNGLPGLEGGKIEITELNGEKVIEFRVQEGYPVINSKGEVTTGCTTNLVNAQTKEYNDDGCVDYGFPTGIWINDCFGIAMRVIIENTPDTTEQSTLYYEYYDPIQKKEVQKGFSGTCYIIDKKTETYSKKVSNGQFQFKEGFDGWIVIPFKTLYDKNAQLNAKYIQENWAGFRFFNYDGRDSEKYGTSNWSKTAMYFGDSVVVEDANTFMANYAKNTEEKVVSDAHNVATLDIPGVMANDCSGAEVYSGLTELKDVKAQAVQIEKPYEKSKALALTVSGYSSISITNDALNYKEIPKELQYKVMDTLGMAFYINVPKSITGTVGFKVGVQEQYTEYHVFNGTYYYTVNDGVAMKNYGNIELQPGFNGVVVLPFELFNYDAVYSQEYVDGLINNPDTIGHFTLEFATPDYPALNSGNIYVDDFYLYQNLEEYITFMLKTQGNDVFEIVEKVVDLKADEEPSFPREMANNCSSITKGEGIFATDNVKLVLVAATEDKDSYINVTIGDGASSVMFENYAKYSDDMSFDEYNNLIGSTGITFWVSVPEDAPMTVGLDLEVQESETEHFWYDPNCWYYTVENGVVTQYYGYLEFKPGFEGAVVVPLECFYFDEFSSTAIDGVLYVELIDYFGLYFDTGYYASIGGTTIGINDIAFCQGNFRFIDAVWAKQTGNGITEVDPMYWSVSADKVFEVVEVAQAPVKTAAPMNNVGSMSTVLGLALLAVAAIIGRRKAEEN